MSTCSPRNEIHIGCGCQRTSILSRSLAIFGSRPCHSPQCKRVYKMRATKQMTKPALRLRCSSFFLAIPAAVCALIALLGVWWSGQVEPGTFGGAVTGKGDLSLWWFRTSTNILGISLRPSETWLASLLVSPAWPACVQWFPSSTALGMAGCRASCRWRCALQAPSPVAA